jgi:hypothetical protein
MSIECLNQALKVEGLTPTKKLILVILGNYADEKGTCYPSYGHIAKMIGLKDTKGVQKTIKEFEELGYLQIEHRTTINGGYTSNRYHLRIGMGLETPRGADTMREGVLEPSNTKDDTKTITKSIDDISFNEFWKEYPRKIGKFQAKKTFSKFDDKDYSKIIYAAKVFANENLATEEKFIPHPTTWLNQKRYLDYINKPIKDKTLNNLAG